MKYTTLKIIEETLTEKVAECVAKAKAARDAEAGAEVLTAVSAEMQRVREALADFNEQSWV